MTAALITLTNIHLSFGSAPLLRGADLTVAPRDRICLVGRNGSGKSTLLKIAAGTVEADRGERFVHPGAIVRYLSQEPDFAGFDTVGAYVEAGLRPTDGPHVAATVLDELGLTGSENPAVLSGGEARRAAIARALAAEPDVLLLDEPTNHLDILAIECLERRLQALKSAIVLISHDRRFLENLSRKTVWLDRGTARQLNSGFKDFEAWRDAVLDEEETQLHKLDRKIARENQWMHGGVTGRRKRNVRRVRELHDLRKQAREHRRATGNVKMAAADGTLSGRLVFEAEGISKSFDGTPVVKDVSVRILRGDRIGFVGANGAGKTTLLKLITGILPPDEGTVRLGVNLEMIGLDQRRDELDPAWTISDALTGGRSDQIVINGQARHVTSYMKDFLFLPEQLRTPVSVLSGGERARLLLARALAKPSNVLVLDEPTNDLDLETLDLLQELLADYPGTLLLVSHDRDFLDRVVASVIVAEGEGRWTEYAGGYTDMLTQRAAPADAQRAEKTEKPRPLGSATPLPTKRKLSFKEKHALGALPAKIEALQHDIAKLSALLADPAFYERDVAIFTATTDRLAAVQSNLEAAESEWLELEMLREELEV